MPNQPSTRRVSASEALKLLEDASSYFTPVAPLFEPENSYATLPETG